MKGAQLLGDGVADMLLVADADAVLDDVAVADREPVCVVVNVGVNVGDAVTVRVTDADAVVLVVAVSEIDNDTLIDRVFDDDFVADVVRDPVEAGDGGGVCELDNVAVADFVGVTEGEVVIVTVTVKVAENVLLAVTVDVIVSEGVLEAVTVRELVRVVEELGEVDAETEIVGETENTSAGNTALDSTCAITSTRKTYLNMSTPGNAGAALPSSPRSTTLPSPATCGDVIQVTLISEEEITRHGEPPMDTEHPDPEQLNQKPCNVTTVPPYPEPNDGETACSTGVEAGVNRTAEDSMLLKPL